MIVKCLRPGDAKEIIEARRRGDELDGSVHVYEIGSGEALSETALSEAVGELEELVRAGAEGSFFDSAASVALHHKLRLDSTASGNGDFWVWLAVHHFSGIVEWRHYAEGGAHLRNYGIGNRWDNLLARLWYRAECAYDMHAPDPYELVRRGAVDYWESGIIRVRYSSARSLVRAFTRFQYPDPNDTRGFLHPTSARGLRLLYKRLKRLQATVAYEFLDDTSAEALIRDLAEDLERT